MKTIKKLICIILTVFLLLSGCTVQENAPSNDQLDQPNNPTTQTESTYGSTQSKIAIYSNRAIYDLEKNGEYSVFSLELEGTQPIYLGKGKLLGVYGSVALAKNSTHYFAMNLEDSAKWSTLQSAKEETVSLQWGDELLLFCHDRQKNYIDVIDLNQLTATRQEMNERVLDAVIAEDTLYYINDNSVLYKITHSDSDAQKLGTVDANRLHYVGTHLLLYRENGLPTLYNLISGTFLQVEVSGSLKKLHERIAVFSEQGEWIYYDISTGKTITESEYNDLLQNSAQGYLEGGSAGTATVYLNGKTYPIDFGMQIATWISTTTAIGSQGMAVLSPQMQQICSIQWSAEENIQTGTALKYKDHPFQ